MIGSLFLINAIKNNCYHVLYKKKNFLPAEPVFKGVIKNKVKSFRCIITKKLQLLLIFYDRYFRNTKSSSYSLKVLETTCHRKPHLSNCKADITSVQLLEHSIKNKLKTQFYRNY